MMRSILFIPVFFCLAVHADAQSLLSWDQLTDVKFSKKFSPDLGIELTEATFGPTLQALDGKEIILRGYMIPLDPLGTQYVLSRNPMASCFFCGGSGPETVAELRLHPRSIRRYATDEVMTFKGTFQLHASNSNSLHYVLLNAEKM